MIEEKYWENEKMRGDLKEQWENINKTGKKGFKSWKCTICNTEDGSLEHIWTCKVAWEGINQKWVVAVQEWTEGREGDNLVRLIKETLKGRLRVELCEYVRAFTKTGRSRTGALHENRKEGTEYQSE